MSNKKTAVEWLEENLIGNPHFESDFIHNRNTFKQAKAIEKEQIIQTYWEAYKEGQYSGDRTAEEYYNETYEQ